MPNSFTPGPWETLSFSQHELQADFAMVKIGKRVHMVGYSDEDKANAWLIAAAPELLEALQDALGDLEYLKNAPESAYARPDDETIKAARAAIAKAGGES